MDIFFNTKKVRIRKNPETHWELFCQIKAIQSNCDPLWQNS